jgi:hypothetical protein
VITLVSNFAITSGYKFVLNSDHPSYLAPISNFKQKINNKFDLFNMIDYHPILHNCYSSNHNYFTYYHCTTIVSFLDCSFAVDCSYKTHHCHSSIIIVENNLTNNNYFVGHTPDTIPTTNCSPHVNKSRVIQEKILFFLLLSVSSLLLLAFQAALKNTHAYPSNFQKVTQLLIAIIIIIVKASLPPLYFAIAIALHTLVTECDHIYFQRIRVQQSDIPSLMLNSLSSNDEAVCMDLNVAHASKSYQFCHLQCCSIIVNRLDVRFCNHHFQFVLYLSWIVLSEVKMKCSSSSRIVLTIKCIRSQEVSLFFLYFLKCPSFHYKVSYLWLHTLSNTHHISCHSIYNS